MIYIYIFSLFPTKSLKYPLRLSNFIDLTVSENKPDQFAPRETKCMSENVIGILVLLLIALGMAAVVYWVYRPLR
jgi:hypothetical protein